MKYYLKFEHAGKLNLTRLSTSLLSLIVNAKTSVRRSTYVNERPIRPGLTSVIRSNIILIQYIHEKHIYVQ